MLSRLESTLPKLNSTVISYKGHVEASTIAGFNTTSPISFESAQALKAMALSNISFSGCGAYLAHVDKITTGANTPSKWKFEIKQDENPLIGRIIIKDNWSGDPDNARELLHKTCENWPTGKKVKFLMSCGGLAKFDWPEELKKYDPKKDDHKEAINILIQHAEDMVKEKILDKDLIKELSKVTDFVSFGVDSCSTPDGKFGKPHVELVCLYDIKNKKFHWTGKSYPFSSQINGLVKVEDLDSHFMKLGEENVLILGCHDLAVFSPRAQAVARDEWRKNIMDHILLKSGVELEPQNAKDKQRIQTLKDKIKVQKPTIVLQHPHTTDTENTWLTSWATMEKQVPGVEAYASSGKWYNADNNNVCRSDVDRVRKFTKKGNTIDIMVSE